MSGETLADRIMAAATRAVYADHDRAEVRAELAALVAEATAERVCRWTRVPTADGRWLSAGCNPIDQWWKWKPGAFCPDCGGRIELVSDA